MHYSATFPYATHLPFEATLTDDGVVTCWISMTYDQHDKQQAVASYHNHRRVKPKLPQQPIKKKGGKIALTDEPQAKRVKPGMEKGERALDKREDGGGLEELDIGMGVWLNWEFKCLDGYQAHAGIGLRVISYSAHGQEFEFVAKCEEDFLGERWVYGIDLWC